MFECKVRQDDGRSYDFGPRIREIKEFLSDKDTLKGLYTFVGDPPRRESANLKEAERLLEDCPVVCKSQRGSSHYRPPRMFSAEEIVLKLGSVYYRSFENFSHIVLHEYTHGLVPCDGRLTKEEERYYSRFKRGQSGFHCTAFKRGLLYLDKEFGLLSESQFTEILELLESKTWKRPYEFEHKYKGQLSAIHPNYIQTRGLTAKQLETTVRKSAKQKINSYLTGTIMREGLAERQMGYEEVCFGTKTTWKDSDVGYCVALFAKDVVLRRWIIEDDSSNGQQAGWKSPFDVHVFSGVTEDLEHKVLQVYRERRYDRDLKKFVYDAAPLSRAEQSAAVRSILSAAQSIHDHLEILGVLGRGLNVALVKNQPNEPNDRDVRVALVFDPSMESTIFRSLSDGHIDVVAHHTLLHNILTSGNLDYRSLSPSDFAAVDSVVRAFINSFPVPLELGDWIPWQDSDFPPYGEKYAQEGILGRKYKPSKLFWRGYLSDRIIAGNPISLPGFFTQFSYNDQNIICGAEGENAPIVHLDGGYGVYRRATGNVHPKFGLIDSGVGVYVESMDIEVDSSVSDFVADLAERLGVADEFEGVAVSFDRGIYSEVLCALKACSDRVRAREDMRRFARGEADSAPQKILSTFDIPYSLSEVSDFAEESYAVRGEIRVYDLEFSVSSAFLEKLLSSRCPTIRLFKSVSTDELCVLVFDGQRVSTLKTTSLDFIAGDVLLEMLTGTCEMSEYGYLDIGAKPRENFKRTSVRGLAEASSDVSALLDLPIMTFTGSGEINLLEIDPDRFSDPFEILSNLDVVPNIPLRAFVSAVEGSALIAVSAEDGDVFYYYRHRGEAFEVTSVVAWWLMYL